MSTNTRPRSDQYARGEALLNKIHGDHTGEAIVADQVIGDRSRLRELQRLAGQLEKERMLT